ncbi:hypothetical protein LJK88_42265 [Paenibacillus sp. P26]|nr:hypothetical protein LJK88_42265 [Paenibacillus sp. P26]UUZ92603.1 hypothetical protein LJK87_46030 [Paenibacillus sp. P25]
MEENKKKAYLILNYQAFLDIKNSGQFNQHNFDQVFRIAHVFHNLALSIVDNFEGFNENDFWESVGGLEKQFGLYHYRKLFENLSLGETLH